MDALDSRRGVLLTSSYEFPGRYARWTLGFADPPIEVSGKGREFTVRALNERYERVPFSSRSFKDGVRLLEGRGQGMVMAV